MKKIIVIGALLFNGHIGFSLENHTDSKCQQFVSDVFEQYDLGLFIALSPFIKEDKPNFLMRIEPIQIPQKKHDKLAKIINLYNSLTALSSREKVALVFQGKTLKDKGYEFTIGETSSDSNPNRYDYYMHGQTPPPLLTHTFHFSSDCKFKKYHIEEKPTSLTIYDYKNSGFHVSADSQCKFNEPNPQGNSILTAHFNMPANYNTLDEDSDHVILKYPGYYKDLCALAKKAND